MVSILIGIPVSLPWLYLDAVGFSYYYYYIISVMVSFCPTTNLSKVESSQL